MGRYCIPGCTVLNVFFLIWCASMWPCLCRNSTSLCRDDERDALVKFRQSLSDPSGLLSSWAGKDCCEWEGIRCDAATGHVIRLELLPSTEWYTGWSDGFGPTPSTEQRFHAIRLSPDLLGLKHLNHLDLTGLGLDEKAAIPEFIGSMKHIRYLNLSNMGFNGTIPSNLGNLSNLEFLDLRDDLSSYGVGSVSGATRSKLSMIDAQWISRLVALKHLDLSGVHLSEARNLMQALSLLPSLAHLALSSCRLDDVHLSHSRLLNSSFLPNLRYLDLSSNSFQGQTGTGAFQNLTSLNYLDISSNSLEGELPEQIVNLKDLKYLSISFNSFTGPIPNSWGKLHSLVTLDLSFNQLYGDIPQWLGQLRSLQFLKLRGNLFNGTVPDSLGQLRDLQVLDLSRNALEGTISEVHFADCSKLYFLDLSDNRLTIKIKSDWVPPFQLRAIKMASCKFETGFPKWLRTQEHTDTLVLSNASISGEIPEWFGNRSFLTLNLSHNQITGPFPGYSSFFNELDLSHNQISGQIPAKFGDKNSHSLTSLLLNDNLITGPIPESFCKLDWLSALDLSGNKLSGNIPECWNSSSTSVFRINVSSNNLTGLIPNSFGNLSSLSLLYLNNNSLHGDLPKTLRFLTGLTVLDLGDNSLSGYLPSWIGENLQSMKVLILRNNQFNGIIPLEFCTLAQLKWLDLALNQLSGTIPTCIRDLRGLTRITNVIGDDPSITMEFPIIVDDTPVSGMVKGNEVEYTTTRIQFVPVIDLSGNNLVGSIPEDLAYLIGLRYVNLSHNLLQGNIPEKVGNMEVLESLDVSANNLSGNIPSSISNLTSLARLNLSINNFSGRIPRSNQLETLYMDDPFMYAGNPLLCGDPLPIRCPGDEVPEPPKDPVEEEHGSESDSSEKTIFYGVIAAGFATGFWGLFGILIFKKTWRVAYFRFAEEAADKVYVAVAVKVTKLKRRMRSG